MAHAACSRELPHPKLRPADQYAAPVAAVVERERSDLPALGVVTPVAEEVVAESLALGGFEKARRDDLVGIYVFRADSNT